MTKKWVRGTLRQSPDGHEPDSLVLKVGGSLLSWPDWPWLLDRLLTGVGDLPLVIVVGGGAVVDGLRQIDSAAPQPAKLMHDLALDCMHTLAQLVSQSAGLPLSANPARTRSACVLDVPTWMLTQAAPGRLPPSWDVTSDSIAARMASDYGAALMLAKSTSPPATWCGESLESLTNAGWVDRFFPIAADDLQNIFWTAPTG
jgi:5-(aminomethyl)-3-furanmethanol phosphate kinase